MIHIIGDIIQSVGVVIAAIIIYIDQNYHMADPICTFVFSIIVMFTTISITKRCINVLMEASPENMNTEQIQLKLKEKVNHY
jgi:zinc transporter 2